MPKSVSLSIPLSFAALVVATAVVPAANAQSWPAKSIRRIDSFVVTSLLLTKNIMRRLWHRHLGSGAREGKAMYPSPDAHSR